MAKHAVHRKKKQKNQAFSFRHAVVLCLCFIGICFGLYLWYAAFTIGQGTPTVDDDDFRPTFGPPPYRIAIDAGHGGSDPGAQGIVTEKEMTAATAEALRGWLEADPNFIPLQTRESYDATAKPAERAAAANALSPDLLAFHPRELCTGRLHGLWVRVLSQCAGPHLASGKLLFRKTPGQRHAFRRGQSTGARGSPLHLLYRRSKAAGRDQPHRSAGRAQFYHPGRCKLSGRSGRAVLCDQCRRCCTVWQ